MLLPLVAPETVALVVRGVHVDPLSLHLLHECLDRVGLVGLGGVAELGT